MNSRHQKGWGGGCKEQKRKRTKAAVCFVGSKPCSRGGRGPSTPKRGKKNPPPVTKRLRTISRPIGNFLYIRTPANLFAGRGGRGIVAGQEKKTLALKREGGVARGEKRGLSTQEILRARLAVIRSYRKGKVPVRRGGGHRPARPTQEGPFWGRDPPPALKKARPKEGWEKGECHHSGENSEIIFVLNRMTLWKNREGTSTFLHCKGNKS